MFGARASESFLSSSTFSLFFTQTSIDLPGEPSDYNTSVWKIEAASLPQVCALDI